MADNTQSSCKGLSSLGGIREGYALGFKGRGSLIAHVVHVVVNSQTSMSAELSSESLGVSSQPKVGSDGESSSSFEWNAITILQSIAIFVFAGIAEIMGGWLVWAAIKGVRDADGNITKKPWYYALLGSLTLVAYGFIPCLQPSAAADGFGRIYAAYGGFFIIMSFLFGWMMEGEAAKPDVGDLIGGFVSLVGVLIIMFWPGR